MTTAYRIGQALRALVAFSQPVEREVAANHLTPELLALFDRMRRSEQAHALNVLRTVLAQGQMPRELAIAALLHDVGKTRYTVRIWQKTIAVVVQTLAPRLYERWGEGDPARWWVRPFVVKAQHPIWSAEMLANAGAPEAAIWLAAHHQDTAAQWAVHPHIHLLQRLQLADDAN
jgi:hypothetical protein